MWHRCRTGCHLSFELGKTVRGDQGHHYGLTCSTIHRGHLCQRCLAADEGERQVVQYLTGGGSPTRTRDATNWTMASRQRLKQRHTDGQHLWRWQTRQLLQRICQLWLESYHANRKHYIATVTLFLKHDTKSETRSTSSVSICYPSFLPFPNYCTMNLRLNWTKSGFLNGWRAYLAGIELWWMKFRAMGYLIKKTVMEAFPVIKSQAFS